MKPHFTILSVAGILVVLFSAGLVWAQVRRPPATGIPKTMTHNGIERVYRLHIPDSVDTANNEKRVPLLLCLHGGGGTAAVASRMGFTPLADEKGFIVAYPEGLDRHWNDGRKTVKFEEHDARTDDAGFIRTLVRHLIKKHPIDTGRIFITGGSNGGFMSQRMAIEASDLFAAAGIMIATLPKPFEDNFHPSRPVSILFMNGTADPLVPYEGGPITPNLFPNLRDSETHDFQRGRCSSTDKAVELWLERNGLAGNEPKIEKLPDKDPDDGCTVERRTWTGGAGKTSVVLYRIDGGGHTIPGGAPYLPERVVGKVCGDFDGVRAVWEFFENHPKDAETRGRK